MQKRTEELLRLYRNRFPSLVTNIKRRRFTILSLIISFAFLTILTLSLIGSFKIETSNMVVGIFPPQKGVKIKDGHVGLHKGLEHDELMIQVRFSITNTSETGKIMIWIPEEFKLSETIGLKGLKFVETWVRNNKRRYTYSLTGSDSPSLFLKFYGSVFTTRARVEEWGQPLKKDKWRIFPNQCRETGGTFLNRLNINLT